ncbi:GAF domain-containing SpoIIE family protein phosphatase [Actinocorallia populi]|uniref:GAF domain-containing SpoIIE family protein phosphatase n=1 Tax=Actinocorallia populi TaxID=2079200 RepID=UPI000D08F85B|nr:SpoIIE family protein phosphatase [Actinocorallia populi]
MTTNTSPARPPGRRTLDEGLGRLATTVERLRREVREAQHSTGGRAIIELAAGVLAERLGSGLAAAHQQLDVLAERAEVPQLEIAADIVAQAAKSELAAVARSFLAGTKEDPEDQAEAGDRMRAAESAALAADDTQAMAASLLEYALAPLEAEAVAVWAADADGSLRLAGAAGFTPPEARRWRHVPPAVTTLARQALVERQPVWLAAGQQYPPSIGRTELAPGARVAVPAGTGGRLLGVLEVCWPGPLEEQPPAVHRQLESLAELCAYTLDHLPAGEQQGVSPLADIADAVLDSAIVLRPVLEDDRIVDFVIHHANDKFADLAGRPRSAVMGTRFLESYPMSAREGGLFDQVVYVHATGDALRQVSAPVITRVDDLTVSGPATYSILRQGEDLLVMWRLHDESTRLAELLQHAQRLGRIGGFEENLLTGEIIWNDHLFELHGLPVESGPLALAELPARVHPDDAAAVSTFLRVLLDQGHAATAAFRLQRQDGSYRHMRIAAEPVLDGGVRPIVIRGAYQDISSQHWTEIALEATRDELNHTQQQAAEQAKLTLRLQHAIMPPRQGPLDTPRLRVGVRYRPAGNELLVGGDWYDVLSLPTGKVLISVGDVAGHGIQSATDMVVLRNALRGLSATGAGPAQMLYWLNNVTVHLTDNVTATAVCGVFDPKDGVLRWARAGHPQPILLRDGKAAPLPPIDGVVLGVLEDLEFEEGSVELMQGDRILLYTDGLIERRDSSVEEALSHLLAIAAAGDAELEPHLDNLLRHGASDTDDDTCVVALEVKP